MMEIFGKINFFKQSLFDIFAIPKSLKAIRLDNAKKKLNFSFFGSWNAKKENKV